MPLNPEQEKIATILYEYEETKKSLALKKAEATRIGNLFSVMSSCLLQAPSYIRFEWEVVPPQFGDRGQVFNTEDFNGEKIKALSGEIRELEMKLMSLTQERKQLGYPVS